MESFRTWSLPASRLRKAVGWRCGSCRQSHTNPVFLFSSAASRSGRAAASAEWCLKGVDQCWSQKKNTIAPAEMKDAEEAYEHARVAYRKISGGERWGLIRSLWQSKKVDATIQVISWFRAWKFASRRQYASKGIPARDCHTRYPVKNWLHKIPHSVIVAIA